MFLVLFSLYLKYSPKDHVLSWKGDLVKSSVIIVLGIVNIIIIVVIVITIAQALDINEIGIRMDVHEGFLKEQFITPRTLELRLQFCKLR